MIIGVSVMVCSRLGFLKKNFLANIEKTIGCDHELIVIDNRENEYSIFQAYNIGIKRSKYPFLVFMHEDIYIHTNNWGKELLSSFVKNPKTGLLGVAGSKQRTNVPAGWWDHKATNLVINIIQHRPEKDPEKILIGFKKNSIEEVVVMDGVFMAMRKDKRISFNEKLDGYHNYDQSISLDFRKFGYKLYVTNEILIEHFSAGNLGSVWLNSNLNFHKIYRKYLPQTIGNKISKDDKIYAIAKFINYCIEYDKERLGFIFWLKYLMLKPYSRKNLEYLKLYINKLIFKSK